MGMSKKTPAVSTPAVRPDRQVEVEPEDVVIGDEDANSGVPVRGKRSLLRPSSATGASTGTSGSGLAV